MLFKTRHLSRNPDSLAQQEVLIEMLLSTLQCDDLLERICPGTISCDLLTYRKSQLKEGTISGSKAVDKARSVPLKADHHQSKDGLSINVN